MLVLGREYGMVRAHPTEGGEAMKLHARQQLVLHQETLRILKVKTGVKAGAPPSHNPTHCG
jgi:hypothetical protein